MGKQFGKNAAQGNSRLDERLRDYSAVTRVSSAADAVRGRMGSWPKYAAVAGSALAMATGASANIITGTIVNGVVHAPHTANSTGQKLVSFQSLAANLNDFVHLKASSGSQSSVKFAALAVFGAGGGGVKFFEPASVTAHSSHGRSQLARIFTSHSPISAGAGAFLGSDAKIVVKKFATSNGFGLFKSGQSGYAGMALKTSQGNQVDYGWLKLKFTDLGDLPNMLEAISFGIEGTPGVAILPGQTVEATPEPGSMSLALLASGALAVAALRRRKAQAK